MAGLDKNTSEHIPGENVLKESRDDLQTNIIKPQGILYVIYSPG